MPAVTFSLITSKIAGSGATSSEGQNSESVTEAASGNNGVMLIGGLLYAVVATSGHDLQVYKSTNDGVTWSTYGSAATPTVHGGGMCVFADGTDIWVGYGDHLAGFTEVVYLRAFDTVGGTWGSEASVNVLTITGGDTTIERPEGPYAGYVRPDGSIVLLVAGTVGNPDTWALIFETGSFTSASRFTTAGVGSHFGTSCMAPDGTVHVFYVSSTLTTTYHQMMLPDNSVSTKVALPGSLIDWNDTGINWGFINGSTIYLGVGKDTSEAGIFGRAAIVYGNDSGWLTTLRLDTDSAVDDYSLYSGILVESGGQFIYVCRLISSDGTHYIIRVGFAAAAAFNNPSLWTWQTLYDLASPDPHVSGEAGAYTPITAKGLNSAVTIDSKGVLRYATTLNGTEQFVAFLFTAIAQQVGNSFRCGRVFSDPDA